MGNPLLYAQQYGLLLWLRADVGIQYGATLRATGTAPPAWTISGTATRLVNIHAEIDSVAGGTALGQATYKWRENESASYTSGVLTAAGPTALGTTGLSVAMAVGPYNIDNKWDITVAQWNDQSGLSNHAVQGTASRQPQFTVAGYGGYSAIDYGTSVSNYGFTIPSIAIGTHSVIGAVAYPVASGVYAHVHISDAAADGSYVYGTINSSSRINRTAGSSGKNVAANWLRDGVRHVYGVSFDGTHAGHLIYKDGVQQATTDVVAADPGLAVVTGTYIVGSDQTFGQSIRGPMREHILFSKSLPPSVQLALRNGIAARAAGAL
jgi:hypothetical protein